MFMVLSTPESNWAQRSNGRLAYSLFENSPFDWSREFCDLKHIHKLISGGKQCMGQAASIWHQSRSLLSSCTSFVLIIF